MTASNPQPAWHPTAEIEFIVGTPPGGGQDRPARTLARILEATKQVDVPIRVTNLPGNGGGHAWNALRARTGDPHVLSISAPPLMSNRILGTGDFDHDALTPVANLFTEYLAFVVPTGSALRDPAALLERLAADPAALTIALATAIGSTSHIAMGQLLTHLGADPRRLDLRVFESAPYAVDDVIAGHAQLGVVSAVSARKAIEAGQVRTLVVSAPARLPGVFSDAPTWTEASVPCVIGQWRGVLAAPGIGAGPLAYWTHVLQEAVRHALWKDELAAHAWTDQFITGEALLSFMDAERAFTGRMLGALGLITRP